MDSLVSLFETKAYLFSEGRIEDAGDTLTTPTAIYIGERIIPIPDPQIIRRMLFDYRALLATKDYHHTEFQLLSSYQTDPGTAVAQVHRTNPDSQSVLISSLRVVHYCRRSRSGWKVALADVDRSNSKLISSIAN